MSNREERRCMRGLSSMWTNVKNLFNRIFAHYPRRRRRNRSSENNVTLVHVSRMSDTEASRNWVDPMIHVNNRAPPRKRYHRDRSPDTLMQIKIALQEQVVKDIIYEEIHKNVIKPDLEMESGEKIEERDIEERKILTTSEELI